MLPAIFAGLLLTVAYPPLALWWVAWVALAPLYVALRREPRAWRGFWRGYGFGWVLFCLGMDWMGQLGAVPWIVLTFIEATWFGVLGLFGSAVVGRGRMPGWARPLLFAALWAVVEYARHVGMYAFPWFVLAATQVRVPAMLQIDTVTGQWGLSFAIALSGACFGEAWEARRAAGNRAAGRWAAVGVAIPVGMALMGLLAIRLDSGDGTGEKRVIAAAQGNVPKPADFHSSLEYSRAALGTYLRLTGEAAQSVDRPDLIEWPETVVPGYLFRRPDLLTDIGTLARVSATPLLVGAADVNAKDQELNSAALFGADGSEAGRYDKKQVVPLGEFFPLRGILGSIYEKYGVPPTDMIAGTLPGTMAIAPMGNRPFRLGVMICYDDVFPVQARTRVTEGAQVLTVLTSDQTFGTTAGPVQHADLAVLRAVETRRWLVRCAATGVSQVITPTGQIIARLEAGHRGVLARSVSLREDVTPYARFGDWFVALCGAGLLFSGFVRRKQAAETATRSSTVPEAELPRD